MKLILAFILPLLITFTNTPKRVSDKVYICDSNKSVAYHIDKNCRGLNRCTHTIIAVTEKQATGVYYKRKCKICY